jgi:hypothetical protein
MSRAKYGLIVCYCRLRLISLAYQAESGLEELDMRRYYRRYEMRIIAFFLLSLIVYLAMAYFFLAPRGYYGTIEQPRFADPWIARTETILSGGLLYRDVFTTTPPLTNLLLMPPALVSKAFGHLNPWSTLSFMIYFSLFNLFGAFVLFYMGSSRIDGYRAAMFFLLNPLTFGNTVLRRQDESIVVFFIGVALLLFLKQHHFRSALAIAAAMLVKLTGGVVLVIALIHSRKWHYLIAPVVFFFLVMAPFLILAGSDAIFWDVNRVETQHPFQFNGVSWGALWNQYQAEAQQMPLPLASFIFLVGVGGTILLIAWKRYGVLEDITILLIVVLTLSPKLHTGYFSMLALTMAPLLPKYRLTSIYLLFGGLAIVADFYKWPIEDFRLAFILMVGVFTLLLLCLLRLAFEPQPGEVDSAIA